jgi:lipoprotein-releasing system permease protein
MPWYLYLAWRQLFPQGRKFPPFALLSILALAFGVALVLVVQSVMSGFGQIHREKIVETSGHLDIGEWGNAFYDQDRWLDHLNAMPEVEAAAPYATGVVMLQHLRVPAFPMIRGLDPEAPEPVALSRILLRGSKDDLDDESIFLSVSLANQLGAYVGATVEVYSPLMIELLKQDEVFLPRELRVAGIFETGWNRFDTSVVITTLRTMQELYDLGDAVHGITVRLRPNADEFAVAAALRDWDGGRKRIQTWKDQWADFLWVLDLEKNLILFITLFVILAISIAIGVIFYLSIVRKTREVGLLASLGGKSNGILLAYATQSLIIGVVGLPLGFGLGVTVLSFRDPILMFLSTLTGTRETLIKFYEFAQLPVAYTANDFMIISGFTLVLVVLSGLLPAWIASRMKPADALRSDA